MQKRLLSIISIVLTATLLLGILPAVHTVKAEGDGTAARGDYIYALSADPDTGSVPAQFGTRSNDGRVWTDKSVAVNGDRFDVTLKALAQEYVSSKSDAATSSIAADVVLILDMTTSMKDSLPKGSGSVQRAEAMVDSVNEAIDIITTTNPNNRISVYSFYGNVSNPTVVNNMPLGHYTSTSTSTSTVGKYITYSSGTMRSSSTLLKDGATHQFSQGMGNGTGTQAGVVHGIKGLIDNINSETDNSKERKPYVILLTDGEATSASKNWYTEDLQQLRTNYVTVSSGGHVNELISTATILSSAYWRDKLEEAYDNYNGAGIHNGVEWFNIGLGIADASTPATASAANCMLNPNYLVGVTPSNVAGTSSGEKIKYYLNQPDYAPAYTAKNYYENDNYVYISPDVGYVTFANSYDVLFDAFTTLANIIKQGSAQITLPIVYHEGAGGSESDVEFTDVIGKGMFVTDITLKPDGKPTVAGEDSNNDGVYEFEGYKTTVTITQSSTGQQTLVWTIPANEVSMFTFADRSDVTSGNYIPAEPLALTYSLEVTDEIGEGPGYTNEFDGSKTPKTTARYEIPGDNSYYYNVVTDPVLGFVSSSLKSGIDSSTDKTDNVTDSCPKSSIYSYTAVNDGTSEASAEVDVKLGNNGKVSFLAYHNNLDIQVVKKWKDINGDDITDTSALPAVTVSLYRTAEGSGTSEFVEQRELSNGNGYTTLWNVPRKDSGGHVYSYFVTEDPPEGYYVSGNTGPLNGVDGTITVTNREIPPSGVISIQKVWQNKVGGTITDTSSFEGIDAQLWRKVSVYTPPKVNVKIYCQDSTNSYLVDDLNLEYGSTLRFKVRAFVQTKANAQSATISFNGSVVPSTYNYVYRSGKTLHHQTTNDDQIFTVKEDMVLTYTVSQKMNSAQLTVPCELVDLVKTDSTATEGTTIVAADQFVETRKLNEANHWKVFLDDLKSSEVIDGQTYSYLYYVKEITAVDGFVTSYSANNATGITGGKLVITNKSTSNVPPLPKTGGIGEIYVMAFGMLIVTTALIVYSKRAFSGKKRRKAKIH